MLSSPSFQSTRPGGTHAHTSGPAAIETRDLRRIYKVKPTNVVALERIDLDVAPGEFFGLLGPNGAGKTTLIKILTTLLLPSEGTARIFGFDVSRDEKKIRRIMNMVAGGEQSGYGILTVREQLWMFSQFYGLPRKEGWHRVDELIDAVGMGDERLQRVSTLSTGQRQKMNIARGLLNDPWILFLDEPTLGLDVAAARQVRELVVAWKQAVPGRTVLLTTHYMAEADELCDRIAIVDHGRILAIGTPGGAQEARPARVDLPARARSTPGRPGRPGRPARAWSRRAPRPTRAARSTARPWRSTWSSSMTAPWAASSGALGGLGSHILALQKSEPSLEDVFVELVGRGFGTRRPRPNGSGRPHGGRRLAGRSPRRRQHATSDDAEASEVA